jgi:hypothetical protein
MARSGLIKAKTFRGVVDFVIPVFQAPRPSGDPAATAQTDEVQGISNLLPSARFV